MNRITLLLSALLILLIPDGIFAQENKNHFDNKPYVEGEFIIQLLSEHHLKEVLAAAPAEYKLEMAEFISPPMLIWLMKFDHHAVSHEAIQRWFYTQKSVTVADYNYYIQMRSTLPGDPSFTQQWHHNNTGQTGGTPDADIDSDLAWDITTGGTTATNDDIVVCLIESGNLDHQDISPNRWRNTAEIPGNGIDDDGNGYIDDYNGWNPVQGNDNYGTGSHGTNCLGMIGAKGNNGLNVAGANWDVKLMVVGDYQINTQANAIAAYTYPLIMRKRWNQSNGTQGAFVVATSASWGIDGANPANYPLWCQFYDTLGYHGILNIGATTNSNLNVDLSGDMPTACPSDYMIGVGRTDHNDNTAGGYGVNTIQLGAPGINIVTTAGTNSITTTTGTSFSCPLTAGVVGLAYSIPCPGFMSIVKSNPKLGADLVREALLGGVDAKPQLATRFITGGRLNSRNTLDLLMAETCSSCFATNIATVPSDNGAIITFDADAEVNATNLRWREVGNSTWTTVTGVTSPYQLNGLTECTTYEYYLEFTCTGETEESSVSTFNTSGCGSCVDLVYCESGATGSEQSRVAFIAPAGIVNTVTNYVETNNWGGDIEDGYVYGNLVLMAGSGANPNEACGTISNAAALSGNVAVAVRGTCDFSEKALNAQNAGATALILINNQGTAPASLGAGAGSGSVTIPVVMISQSQGASLLSVLANSQPAAGLMGIQHEWIESFTLNGVVATSGDNNGYAAPGATNPIPLDAGGTYPFTLIPGFDGQVLPEYTRIWLDANQNGTFEANELVFDQGTASLGTVTGVLTIPAAATTGSTRLRVQMAYQGTGQTTLPAVCGNFTWGEVEDYCVKIESGAACNFVATSTIENPTCNGTSDGSISVNITGGTAPYTYSWNPSAGNVSSLNGAGAGNYSLTVTDATGCDTTISYTLVQPAPAVASFTSSVNQLSVTFANTSSPGATYSWDFGDGNTSTQDNPVHTYAVAGIYNVCLDVTTTCGTVTTCNNVATANVGLDEITTENLSVYPNPSKEVVNFRLDKYANAAALSIVDLVGKELFRTGIDSELTTVNVANLSAGTYLYRMISETGAVIHSGKIIIEN